MKKTEFKELIRECIVEVIKESNEHLIDKTKPWVIVTFEDKTGKHKFYSVINSLSGERITGFDNSPPSVDDSIGYVNSIIRDISKKAKSVKIDGNIYKEKQITEKLNHLREKEYNSYKAWVAGVKKIDPSAKFTGDKDANYVNKRDEADKQIKESTKSLNLTEGEKMMLDRIVGHFSKNPSISAKNIDNVKIEEIKKFVDIAIQKIKSPEQKTVILAIKNKLDKLPLMENDQPSTETTKPQSEMDRTKNDFEAGKIARKLEKPISVKVKALLQFKNKTTGQVTKVQPNAQIDVFCGSSGIYTFLQDNKTWAKLGYANASKYLSKFKPQPSMRSLEKMSSDGIVTTPLGSRVEPDGVGQYGDPSWLMVVGVI